MNGQHLAEQFLNASTFLILFIYLAFFILFCLIWYYIAYFCNALTRDKKLPKGKTKYKFAVLIPARNEDKVIENLLISLKNQTYPKELFDVFVIVESKDDPTIKKVKNYGYNTFIRQDLVNKRTKGYALNEVYQYIRSQNLEYDSFLIVDADNILARNYISLMNDVKNQGYQVGMGYRNFTNSRANWIAATSATLFTFMNQYTSKGRAKLFEKITLTGTGYFVDKKIIDNLGEWIFTGMTEDCELTCYCYYHDIKMYYYPLAQYYDEQPTDYATVHKQHVRWVWGFFNDRTKFKQVDKNTNIRNKFKYRLALFEYNVSIYPFVAMAVLLLLALLASIGLLIASIVLSFFFVEFQTMLIPVQMLYYIIDYFLLLEIPFIFVAMIVFMIANKYLRFNFKTRMKVYFTYLIFFADFLFAFFDGLIHKNKRTTWEAIPHTGNVTEKGALEGINDKKSKK